MTYLTEERRLAAEEQARVDAEMKKSQYDEFVKQAEALAERREQVPIAPAAPRNRRRGRSFAPGG